MGKAFLVFGLVLSLGFGSGASAQGVGDEGILFAPEDTDSPLVDRIGIVVAL